MHRIEILGIDKFKGKNVLSGYYVNTLADHLVTSHQHIEKPHKHDFYATMVFTSGMGSHTVDFKTYEVKRGSVFMMSPGQVHHWELSEDADGFIFFHTAAFYEMRFSDELLSDYAFFSQVRSVDHVDLPASVIDDFTRHFREMSEAGFRDEKSKRHFIISHITQIYLEIDRALPNGSLAQNRSGYAEKFSQFAKLLETRFREEKSPEYYAAALHITAKHLNRINRETVGQSTSGIILDRVMLEARRKLIHATGNYNEIASALGYDDYAYFSKLFKKKVGVTPSGFRKRFR
ncbi:helix-turn-helix domain-containing protein [Flavobacterium selenitireducens]|uniref:helix-turn-helix domain-containing protein n=1 Tax=Flavobacterium selenitireducens TaxID=2722704 RepID=UPI00168A8E0B|nr:AraC family transcriptional regulator [Flavobacterium selenitireducens]MBD3582188.1 helix-turn-helix domain-containing protein [Flavobacterium selenitireducens]